MRGGAVSVWVRGREAGARAVSGGLATLLCAAFAMNVASGIQGAAYTNFVVQDVHVHAVQLGLIEACRETSGLLCFVIMGMAARLPLTRLAAAGLVLMGCGIALLGRAGAVPGLIVASFLWGLGFHTFLPISPALTLAMGSGRAHRSGLLARLNGVGAVAGPVGTFAMLAMLPWVGLRGVFLPAALVALVAAMLMWRVRNRETGARPRFVVRRRYLPYYVLTLVDGARKQILITFVVFAVVSVYHANVVTVALFLLAGSLLTVVASPYVGHLIARYGERTVLVVSSVVLIPVFLGYGLTSSEAVMIGLYIVDNAIFTANVALQTWVGHHAPEDEVPATLAAGTTVNHISSVVVPLVAGFLWQAWGYRTIFIGAAGIAVIAALLTLWLLPAGADAPTASLEVSLAE